MQVWWLVIVLLVVLLLIILFGQRQLREVRAREWQLQAELAEARAVLDDFHASQEIIETAANATSELVLLIDPQLNVFYANQAAQDEFGGLDNPVSLIGYARSLELERNANDLMNQVQAGPLEALVRLDDKPFAVQLFHSAPYGVLVLSDSSELQRLSRARQDLVGNLSHELRTPLTSLRLIAETFGTSAAEDPEVAHDLAEKVIIEVDLLNQMTREMLDLAAIESGQQVVRLLPIRLDDLVREPVERMEEQAQRSKVSIRVKIDGDYKVLADEEQAGRALVNVLHNAIKFSPDESEVILGGHSQPGDGQRVLLTIDDSGPGIHPAELNRIFERFYRSDQARGTPGTGLGLAIALHIMEAHGGRIWAENKNPPERGALIHLAFQPA